MIRKFNFTGRKRIRRDRVKIDIVQHSDKAPSFDAAIDLDGLGLPSDAAVYLEVYDKSSYMRFDFGTVSHLTCPSDRQLVDLQSRDVFSFRVKVVDRSGSHGMVLAMADSLPPIVLDNARVDKDSLLAVSSEDLQDQVWKLDFSKEIPVLVLNSSLDDLGIRELVRSDDLFSALILPSVFRQVLSQILLVEGSSGIEEMSWQGKWLEFVEGLGVDTEAVQHGTDSETAAEWIDGEAVPAFCRRLKSADRLRHAKLGDGG